MDNLYSPNDKPLSTLTTDNYTTFSTQIPESLMSDIKKLRHQMHHDFLRETQSLIVEIGYKILKEQHEASSQT